MRSSPGDARPRSNPAGVLLRQWRGMRGKTQLDLSLEAGVSQKHISFIESGRSAPSRQMLLDLAQALEVPLRERNALLVAAGYAPVYGEDALEAGAMTAVNKALDRMLRQHEPFPAVVMDRHWNVLRTNEAAPRFFNCFIDMAARQDRRNLLDLMFDPAGMRPFIADWPEVAKSLFARVHRETLGHVIDLKTRSLLKELAQYPDIESGWRAPTQASAAPVIPIGFRKGAVTLNYFSMITTVGTPQAVAAEELRLECLFPADEATEAAHEGFVLANSSDGSSRRR